MQKEREEAERCLRQRLVILPPGRQKLYESNTVCKAKSIAFLIIVAAAWDLQDQSAACSSQAMDFLGLWTAYGFGFLSVMQPKADESATQDSKSSEGSQHNGYQHGRVGTWKSRKKLLSSEGGRRKGSLNSHSSLQRAQQTRLRRWRGECLSKHPTRKDRRSWMTLRDGASDVTSLVLMLYQIQCLCFVIAERHLINVNQLLYVTIEPEEKRKRSWLMTNLFLPLLFPPEIFVRLPVDGVSLLYHTTTSTHGVLPQAQSKTGLHCSFILKAAKLTEKILQRRSLHLDSSLDSSHLKRSHWKES